MRARRQSASRGHGEVLGNYHRRKPSIMTRLRFLLGWSCCLATRQCSTSFAKRRRRSARSCARPTTTRRHHRADRNSPHSRLRDGSGRVGFAHSARRRRPCSRHGISGTIRKRRDRGPPRHLLSAAARDSFNDVITPTSLHGTFKYCVDGTEIVDAR